VPPYIEFGDHVVDRSKERLHAHFTFAENSLGLELRRYVLDEADHADRLVSGTPHKRAAAADHAAFVIWAYRTELRIEGPDALN
jgi:hypothetical protein